MEVITDTMRRGNMRRTAGPARGREKPKRGMTLRKLWHTRAAYCRKEDREKDTKPAEEKVLALGAGQGSQERIPLKE